MWHVVPRDGDEFGFLSPSADKDVAVALVRALLELHDAVRVMFVGEAWSAFAKNEEESAKLANHLNEHRGKVESWPSREEVVVFNAEDEEQGFLSAHRMIQRPDGRKPFLGPLVIPKSNQAEGRMVGLLPRRGMTQ